MQTKYQKRVRHVLFVVATLVAVVAGVQLRNVLADSRQSGAIAAVSAKQGFQGLILDSLAEANLIVGILESSDYISVRAIEFQIPQHQPHRKTFALPPGFLDVPLISSHTIHSPYLHGTVTTFVNYSTNSSLIILFAALGLGIFVGLSHTAIARIQEIEVETRYSSRIKELAFMAAHDIRSPLAALQIGIARLDHQAVKDQLLRSTRRLHEVAQDLLDLARRGTGASTFLIREEHAEEPVGLYGLEWLVQEVINEKKLIVENTREITFVSQNPPAESIVARLNPITFKRVISNLIDNAIDATTVNGRITVELSTAGTEHHIHVSDDGHGFPESGLQRIGSKNFSSKKKDGTGLGLFHAKKFAEDIKGKLEVTSPGESGTTIELVIPRARNGHAFRIDPREKPDAVLVDNDIWIREAWQGVFQGRNKILWVFRTSKELFLYQGALEKTTPIFIDRHLDERETGDEIAKKLSDEGFRKLYLSTSESDPEFDRKIFQGVVPKTPPDWLF